MVNFRLLYLLIGLFILFLSCEEKKKEKVENPLQPIQNQISKVINDTKDSIVMVVSYHKDISPKYIPQFEDFETKSLGSGFVVDKDENFLYILTNSHVIEGKKVKVFFTKDLQKDAIIVGKDDKSDITVLKVKIDKDLQSIKPLKVGSTKNLKVGYFVLSAGSPYGLGKTYTFGIISALHRNLGYSAYEDYIQTDAPINPGNSGGALFDIDGRVIGMNTAVIQAGEGIGFAIPIETVMDIYRQIRKFGKVPRGWLGVLVRELSKEEKKRLNLKNGVVVVKVFKDSPAEKAGIKVGDVILSINQVPISSAQNLAFFIQRLKPDTKLAVNILRKGKTKTLEVIIKSPDMVK